MIPRAARLTIAHISVADLRPTEFWPRDPDRINRLVQLLLDSPEEELEPALVRPVPGGYAIQNGHHRWLAHLIAGRQTMLTLVEIRPPKDPQ
jgi:ParB-like chromosome segregation protein Spo0J